jgi:hypothetical protein
MDMYLIWELQELEIEYRDIYKHICKLAPDLGGAWKGRDAEEFLRKLSLLGAEAEDIAARLSALSKGINI